jgi:hypothetical protein
MSPPTAARLKGRLVYAPLKNPRRKPKPISRNPNRLNQKLGSFLHFALRRLWSPRARATCVRA